MLCKKCGSTMNEGSTVCGACGNTAIPQPAQPSAQPTYQQPPQPNYQQQYAQPPQPTYQQPPQSAQSSLPISIQRIILTVLAFLGMMATFMSWMIVSASASAFGFSYSTDVESIKGSTGDGWLTFGVFVIILAVSAIGNWKKPLGKAKFVCCGFGVLNAVIAIAIYSYYANNTNELVRFSGDVFSARVDVSMGAGIWLVILTSIGIAITSFIKK